VWGDRGAKNHGKEEREKWGKMGGIFLKEKGSIVDWGWEGLGL